MRILFLFENLETLDPLTGSIFSIDKLSEISDQNEIEAAKNSLNAELTDWTDGKKLICRDWIKKLLVELSPYSAKLNMEHLLEPIYKVLEEGNQAMQWIKKYEEGLSIQEIMKYSIEDMIRSEEKSI